MMQGDLSLDAETGRAVRAGSPVVPRDRISGRTRGLECGAVVDLHDGRGFAGRGLFDPASPFALRVLTRDRRQALDAAFWRAGVERAADLRKSLPGLSVTDAFRVVHSEGDRLPGLVVESYSSYAVIRLESEALRPHLGAIVDAVRQVLQPRGLYEKRSGPDGGRGHHLGGSTAPDNLAVREGNLRFLVRMAEGAKTGLFLDQRDQRRALARLARGRRVANAFCFTGTSSLTLAAAGAARVASIDPSARSIGASRENFAANGLPPESHDFVVGDPRDVLARISASTRRFDAILVDSPWFAARAARSEGRAAKKGSSKKRDRGSSSKGRKARRPAGKRRRMAPPSEGLEPYALFRAGWSETLAQAFRVLTPGGLLLLSLDSRKLGFGDAHAALRETASASGVQVQVVESLGPPSDFPVDPAWPEGNTHRFLVCTVRPA